MKHWPPCVALLLLTAVSCDEAEPTAAVPQLPALELRPFLPVLEERSSQGTQLPDEKRLLELRELMELAFQPEQSGARLAARAEKSLLDSEDAFWILEQGLEHDVPGVRSKAAYHLGHHGAQASVLKLLRRLKYEQDPAVLVWVAQALALLDNHAGLPHLVFLMGRPENANDAGLAALEICRACGIDPGEGPSYAWLQEQLQSLHRHWRSHGTPRRPTAVPAPEVELLTTARMAAHLAYLESLQLRPVDDAKFALTRAGTLPVPLLTEAVAAQEPYLRNGCLLILEDLGRAAAAAGPAVLPLLGDPLSAAAAARTLGALGTEAAAPHLRAMLGSADTERRAAAAFALGPLGDAVSAPRLEQMMADQAESMDVRVAAAFSMAIFELDRPARRFLQTRKERGEYHEATIDELLERVERYR